MQIWNQNLAITLYFLVGSCMDIYILQSILDEQDMQYTAGEVRKNS